MIRRLAPRAGVALVIVALLLLAALGTALPAAAAVGPKWQIESMANTTAAPGSELTFTVQVRDDGDEDLPLSQGGDAENCVAGAPPPANPAKCYRLHAEFPAGMKPVRAVYASGSPGTLGACASPVAQAVTCSVPMNDKVFAVKNGPADQFYITVKVAKEAEGKTPSATFEVAGAEAGSASTVDPTLVTKAEPQFGVDAFDTLARADLSGAPSTQAGSHPQAQITWIDQATRSERPLYANGEVFPVEPMRDTAVDLPPGFVGNPSVGGRCTASELGGDNILAVAPDCPPDSQLGRVYLMLDSAGVQAGYPYIFTADPLYNMVPPPGAGARFGFNILGTVIVFDARLHQLPDGHWTLAVTSAQTTTAVGVPKLQTEFWGVPASPEHEFDRACAGGGAPRGGQPSCPSNAPREETFFRMPTSCTEAGKGLPWSVHLDSWWKPGATLPGGAPDLSDPDWKSLAIESHQPPGYPFSLEPSIFPVGYSGPTEWGAPVGTEGCEEVPFEPTPRLQPTTPAADSPSGLHFEIQMPQHGLNEPGAIAESDLKAVSVKLPEGFASNASSTEGLSSCSAARIGLKSAVGQTPAVFSGGPQSCPDSSKVGSVEIETPLLTEEESEAERPLHGAVYLAAQHENPFGSLLALYLVVEDPRSGTILKLPGEVKADAKTGQIETIFENNPQLPFSRLQTEFFPGPRAVLKTPSTCGTYHAQVTLIPWSGNPPQSFSEPIEINSGPGGSCPTNGFEQKLSAGTANPLAGAFSPFSLELSREDGTQELAGLSATLPEGLLAKLAGIPYCPDSVLASISPAEGTGRAEEQNPSCPAASLIGRVIAGAGPGPDPAYVTSGRAYLAGPYKGAPLSLAAVVPAVVGPFDLGSVVVRNALRVNPETAQTTAVSDPFPTILYGLPVQLRDLRIETNRPNFTLNPTSCEPMKVETQLTSSEGATASPSVRFQVAGCEALPFKPKLKLRLTGKTNRAAHPALKATLIAGASNEANVSRAAVTLPPGEILDNAHIRNVCTRVQFAGAGCPQGSVLGSATVVTPLLDKPLEGPVYLMSGFGHKLPDVAVDLHGQINVFLHGRVDTGPGGGIRTTFEGVPDAFASKFILSLKGGKRGLIQNQENICARPQRATLALEAHNGKAEEGRPALKIAGCAKHAKGHKRHRGH